MSDDPEGFGVYEGDFFTEPATGVEVVVLEARPPRRIERGAVTHLEPGYLRLSFRREGEVEAYCEKKFVLIGNKRQMFRD